MNILRNIYLIATDDFTVIGIGETKFSFEKRHKDGDWAKFHNFAKAKGLKVILVGWWENVDISDRDIHKWYKLEPNICKYSEWFAHKDRIPLDVQHLKYKIEKKFFSNTPENKKSLELRPHQRNFVAKILSNWEQWIEFLLFAKCRGGKSIMTLSTIVEAGVERTLIVSRFNSPKQSWFDDCDRFDKFKNIVVIKLNEDDWVDHYNRWANVPDIHIIFWSTIQGLCASKNSRLNKLKRLTPIELIVFDECHIGEDAEQFKKVRNKFIDAKCLKVSGTAYDQVWDYDPEHRFTYSYWDEHYYYPNKYPKMNVYTIDINVVGYREIFGDDPDAFTNIFLVNEDETAFLHPDLVRNFWNKYFTTLGQRHLRHNERIIINRNHIIASLPSVAACRLSVPLLTEYAALDVTGISGENSDSINKFVSENSKTICLTVEANVLGVTCKEWDCVVHLYKGKDKKRWTQLSFRGGSGDHDWDVVDFAPRRALNCLQDSLILAKAENSELEDIQITDFINVFEWDECLNKLSQEKVFDVLSVDFKDEGSQSFKNLGRYVSLERLNDEDLSNVHTYPESSASRTDYDVVNDNDTNDESAVTRIYDKDKELTKKEKNDNKKKLEEILTTIPLALTFAMKFDRPIRTPKELYESKYYAPITEDYNKVLYNLICTRDISERDLRALISHSNHVIEKTICEDFTKVIDGYRMSKGTHQSIPLEYLRELLKDVDLSGDILVTGDPTGVICSYLINELGIPSSKIWVWENHPTHQSIISFIDTQITIIKEIKTCTMKFDVALGNQPYQTENKTGKKGKGGNNSLYIPMVKNVIDLLKDGGIAIQLTPPAGLVKSTEYGEPTDLLKKIKTEGSLKKLDLTVRENYFPKIASGICSWSFVKGETQDSVEITTHDGNFMSKLEELYFLGIAWWSPFKKIEHDIYSKIVSNKDGDSLVVVRGNKRHSKECTMARFGYPKIQRGGHEDPKQVLGFDDKFYDFFTSKVGLWLINYVSRHDKMIYHNLLSGIHIPKGGFNFTDEEHKFIENGKWVNFNKNG